MEDISHFQSQPCVYEFWCAHVHTLAHIFYLIFFCAHNLAAYEKGQAATAPINIHRSVTEIASDYTKKQNVLQLKLHDGAEFLFEFSSPESVKNWLTKIQFFAGKSLFHL